MEVHIGTYLFMVVRKKEKSTMTLISYNANFIFDDLMATKLFDYLS